VRTASTGGAVSLRGGAQMHAANPTRCVAGKYPGMPNVPDFESWRPKISLANQVRLFILCPEQSGA